MSEMSGIFDQCTREARRALSLAEEEARRSKRINTKHLLLGLLKEGGLAASILNSQRMTVERVRAQKEVDVKSVAQNQSAYTSNAAGALRCAKETAQRTGVYWVDTEQLLLGLVQIPQGAAAKILQRSGVNIESAISARRMFLP